MLTKILNSVEPPELSVENLINLDYSHAITQDLTNLFDEVIEAIGDTDIYYDDLEELTKELADTYSERFKKTIKKHTGIELYGFRFLPILNAYFTLHRNFKSYDQIDKYLSYGSLKGRRKNKLFDLDFNFDTGKFLKSSTVKFLRPVIAIGIFLPLAAQVYGAKKKKAHLYNLTAVEMTAITLHEIGHFITIVSSTAMAGYTGTTMNLRTIELYKDLKNAKNDKEYTEKALDILGKAKEFNSEINAKSAKKISNLIDKSTDYFISVIRQLSESKVSAKRHSIIINTYLIALLFLLVLVYIFKTMDNYKHANFSLKGKDKSREIVSSRNVFMNERWADEYVSKLGVSEALGTGLGKLHRIPTHIKEQDGSNLIKQNYLISNLCDFSTSDIYEEFSGRINRLIQNNIAFLKDFNADENLIKEILIQNKNLATMLKRRNKAIKVITFITTKLVKVFETVLLLKPVSIWLGNMSVLDTYTKLFNQFDSLMSNKLYESSAKLKQFTKK